MSLAEAERTQGAEAAVGPPWFLAYFLFDGDSTQFFEFVSERVGVLGRAWGKEVLGRRVGHPNQIDEFYNEMRAEFRARLDADDVARYEALVAQRGSERHHVVRETEVMAKLLGVPRNDLPAIACQTLPAGPRTAVLRIRPEWFSEQSASRALSQALQDGLSPERVRPLIGDVRQSVSELTAKMQRHLDGLHEEIRRCESGLARRSIRRRAARSLEQEALQYALVIDTRGRRVFFRGHARRVTELTFKALLYLAESASFGSAWVARDELAKHLWPDEEVDDNRIDSVVYRVRSRLKHVPSRRPRTGENVIPTLRKAGCRLNLDSADILIL